MGCGGGGGSDDWAVGGRVEVEERERGSFWGEKVCLMREKKIIN